MTASGATWKFNPLSGGSSQGPHLLLERTEDGLVIQQSPAGHGQPSFNEGEIACKYESLSPSSWLAPRP